jgi:GntR family transcriptional regulator/MocR family aminotransferase
VKRRVAAPLVISLDRSSGVPLALQIANQARAAIRTATVAPDARLPSSRALAAELGVARGVVEQAFDQLGAEGWVESRRGAGTFVAREIRRTPAQSTVPAGRVGNRAGPLPTIRLDSGTPWIDRRQHDGWRRAWRTVAAADPPPDYPDPAGLPGLRHALAEHVAMQRGVVCTPDQVLVTAGTTHAFALILGGSARAAVAIEDPGYRAAVATAQQLGWAVVDIAVDDAGLEVDALTRNPRTDIRAVYVTPAHQHPLGMVLSAPRRIALVAEARRRGAVVIEDDYDSEFRYDVAPLPALATLGPDDVVYVGTASKTIAPGLRIGWLVADEARVAEIAERRAARHDHPSWPVQRALQAMLDDGHVARVVRSARRLYAHRSRLVRERLSPYGAIGPGVAGMYLRLDVSQTVAAYVVAETARAGIEVPSVAAYCRTARRSGLVIGFGGVSDSELEHALEVIETALVASAALDNQDAANSGVVA